MNYLCLQEFLRIVLYLIFYLLYCPLYSAYLAFYFSRFIFSACYIRLCLTLRLVWIMLRHDIWLWVANMLEKEACSCAGQFPGGLESSVVRVQVAPTDKYLSRKSSGTKEHTLFSLWPYASWFWIEQKLNTYDFFSQEALDNIMSRRCLRIFLTYFYTFLLKNV